MSRMKHSTVTLAVANVHKAHPFKNPENHQELLSYLQERLMLGRDDRDNRTPRYASIDKSVSGWMRLSDEDRERLIEKERNGTPQAITVNLPLTWVHLDDMMTYFAQTFSPNRGMFYQTGDPDEATAASQIVGIMNNHAIYGSYYRQVLMTSFSALKYNIGGFEAEWSQDTGPKLTVPAAGQVQVTQDVIWQGNKIRALDMYNTMWDPSVNPTEVYKEGEWCAEASMCSYFTLQKMCSTGMYFNCEEAMRMDEGINQGVYYRNPPSEARLANTMSQGTDWKAILSESPAYMTNSGFERVKMYCRLNPMDFGLLPNNPENRKNRNRLEIWRFTILNDKYIIDATPMNNIHGYLPFVMGMVNDDLMGTSQKSVAEIIEPLQSFASFLLNTHVRATRKNIWGLTVYDPTMVDLAKIPEGEVSAKVPMEATGQGRDIRTGIWESQGNLDTKQTLGDLEATMGIINQFFPTQSLPSQIASIDRAVDSQVAAVQQGTNRRNQKTAKLLDDSLFRPLRFILYYNIIQFQPDGATVTDFYGKPQVVNLQELRNTDLPFIIGQGLAALDRQAAAGALQNIIFAIIQNPAVAQQIDLLGLIDYWTNMIDIDLNMRRFHVQQTPEGTPNVGADGQPVTQPDGKVAPLSDPQNITNALANPVKR